MRYAFISDIHANDDALHAVLEAIDARGADRVFCLGDIVGIHTRPGECIDLLVERGVSCLAGNHDEGVRGTLDARYFPEDYWTAILWTRMKLTPAQMAFLRGLPTHATLDGGIWIMHGMMGWSYRYLVGPAKILYTAARMGWAGITHAFFGHTHRAVCHRCPPGVVPLMLETVGPSALLDAASPGRYLCNPGSVGEPRDGHPEATYALFDTGEGTISWHSVRYDRDGVLARERETIPEWGALRDLLA